MSILTRNGNQPALFPPKPKVELKRPDEVHAIEAGRLMEAVAKFSRGNYVMLMASMEDRYPGIGWAEMANDLENFYERQNLALSDKKGPTLFK